MRPVRRLAFAAFALASIPSSGGAQGGWSDPVQLDGRSPLELTRIAVDPTNGVIYFGALFDLATNSLELARVDLSQFPPATTFVPIVGGNLFALGPIVQGSGEIGFPYLDSNFDLFFAQCAPPCDSVTHPLLHPGSNYVDTSAAGAGGRFYVAATDFASGSIIVRSSFDGSNWAPHRTVAPQDLYINFDGGKRIQLIVDPDATDPGTAFNCLLLETLPPPGTATQIRINCANGDDVLFDQVIDSDVPNPLGQFDPRIETAGGGSHDEIVPRGFFAYSHRSSNSVRGVVVDPSGVIAGPIVLGPAPTGDQIYGLGAATLPSGNDRMVWSNDPGEPANDVEWDPSSGATFVELGPTIEPGPITMMMWEATGEPGDAFLWAFTMGFGISPAGGPEGGSPALVATRARLPFFEDGFEDGDTLAWSSTSP